MFVPIKYCVCRGEKFRTEFLHLGEVCSIVSESVRVMALTATATTASCQFIIKSLCMQSTEIISVSPNRDNIIQRASEADSQSCSIEISDIYMYVYVRQNISPALLIT